MICTIISLYHVLIRVRLLNILLTILLMKPYEIYHIKIGLFRVYGQHYLIYIDDLIEMWKDVVNEDKLNEVK